MPVPQLTEEQRREALQKADKARRECGAFLARVRSGEIGFAEAIGDPVAQKCKVETLLRAMPGYGFAKTRQLMTRLGIAPNRRVKGLGSRQREGLLEAVGDGK